MDTLIHDFRYALRQLTRNPGLTAAMVAVLGLGVGANVAIFSVVEAVLLRSLPYADPERIVTLWEREASGDTSLTSYATFSDWKTRSGAFSELSVASYWIAAMTGNGDAERLEGLRVTDGFFRALGVAPVIGRDFTPEEHRTGNHRVALLTYGLWQRRFGADPGVVGRIVQINGIPHRIAGVLPRDFAPLLSNELARPAEIYAPLGYDPAAPWACRTCRHLRAIARIKPELDEAAATADLERLSQTLFQEHPTEYSAAGVVVRPLSRHLTAGVRPALRAVSLGVALVLLIACVNLASLELARLARSQGELALRATLGASRGRLLRLSLARGLLLAAAAGSVGVLSAGWMLQLLLVQAPPGIPRLDTVGLNPRVLLYALAITLVSAVGVSLVPALRAGWSTGLSREAGDRTATGRLGGQRLLVASEVALTLVLLVGAGLVLKSLGRVLEVDPGFAPRRLLTAELSPPGASYERPEVTLTFYDAVRARLAAQPGVVSTAVVSQLPLGGDFDRYGVHVEGRVEANPEAAPSADRYAVSPGYLATMGIPLLAGRGFDDGDRADSRPVALVNRTLAARFWPGGTPLGARIQAGGDRPWLEIVGVVGDVRHASLEAPDVLQIYVPQNQWTDISMVLVVRTSVAPAELSGALRAAVAAIDPDVPVAALRTMDDVMSGSLAGRRFAATLVGLFAAAAVALAAVGIGGVLSAALARRTREFGVRLALGAGRRDVLSLALRQGMTPVMVGSAFGLAGGAAVGRMLASLLFRVSPWDGATFSLAAGLLLAVALAACLLPARRAASVDPIVALRYE